VSEEENLPSAEEMRARYADLMKDETSAEAGESTPDSPLSTEPEPEPPAEPEPVPEPDPSNLQSPISDLSPDPEPIEEIEDIPDPAEDLAEHLLDVNVRFWAELGRARLPLAEAVALGTGAIVDLDKEPDEELDVLVNGLPFAKGKLLLVDGEWAIRLERIVAAPEAVEHASNSGSGA
jgi:flagellar motor switch protein FliN